MAFQGDSIFWVEVEKVVPNPFQPRREFNESKLKELSESIRMYGVLQPLTVTRKEIQTADGAFRSEYELIAGERRLRASKLAGLIQVPVIIRQGEDSEQEKLELAIIENLQREDLNAVDRALAFRQLADVFELSHAAVARKVGRSREYVSNTMRLLMLPDYMLESLKVGDISEGHARTLLMLNDRQEEQDTVYREILLKKLSVREVERITRKIAQDKVRSKKWQDTDPELIEMEKQFTETLGTRVQIAKTDYGGKLTIDYFSQEDLDKLLDLVKQEGQAGLKPAVAAVATAEVMTEAAHEAEEALALIEQVTPLQTAVSEPVATPPPADHEVAESINVEALEAVPVATETPVVPEAPEPMPEPTPVASEEIHTPAEQTGVESEPVPENNQSPAVPPAATPAAEPEPDDSDLYAIKNFGL